jgi:hypothetical protein
MNKESDEKEMKNRRKTASRIIKRRHRRSEEKSSLISRDGGKVEASKKGGKIPLDFRFKPLLFRPPYQLSPFYLSLYAYLLSSWCALLPNEIVEVAVWEDADTAIGRLN